MPTPNSSSVISGNCASCARGLVGWVRDIRHKIAGQDGLEAAFRWPLARADRIRSQQQRQRG